MRSLSTVLLCVATVLALLLRAPGLSGFAITHWDEGLVWRGTRYFLTLGAEGHYSPTHGPPLVSLVLAGIARVSGARPEIAVWWNVLVGAATVPAAYAVARQLGSPRAGHVAAFLFAGSGLAAMFSRTLLTETTYAFFLLASLAASLRALERPRAGWYLAAGVLVACTQATKYNGCLAAVPLGVVTLARFLRTPEGGGLGQLLGRLALLGGPAAAVIVLNLVAIASVGDLAAFLEHYGTYVGAAAPLDVVLGTLAWVVPWPVLALAPLGLLGAAPRPGRPEPPGLPAPAGRGGRALLHVAFAIYVLFLLRYAFYLRLLVPVVSLLCVYAGLGVDAATARLPRRARPWVALLFLALVGWQAAQRAERFYLTRFDGYPRAAAWLEQQPAPDARRGRLFATQHFVWQDLQPEPPAFALPSTGASEILAGCEEVELVVDIGAFSRLRPWNLTGLFPTLRERYLVRRFPATLNLDVLQNNLTLDELRGLHADPELAERVLSIHVFRLPSAELARLVAAGE